MRILMISPRFEIHGVVGVAVIVGVRFEPSITIFFAVSALPTLAFVSLLSLSSLPRVME
jgi:hypothetical protein